MENFYEPLLKRIKLDEELPDIRDITEELLSNDQTQSVTNLTNAHVNTNVNQMYEIKWSCELEWKEKPSNMMQTAQASLILLCNTHTYDSDIVFLNTYLPANNTSDSNKILLKVNLNLLSLSILNLLFPITKEITPNKLVLHTESTLFKTTFSQHAGGLVMFKTNNHNKLLLVIHQDNELICRVPTNESDFLKMVKEIIERTKQQYGLKESSISQKKENIQTSINSNVHKTNLIQSSNDDVQCPVCLETLNEIKTRGAKLKAFWNCGHVACESCCKQLTTRNKKINCPQCRIPSNVKQIRALHI